MRKLMTLIVLFLFISAPVIAQDIEIIVHDTVLSDTVGAEIVFDIDVINISSAEQTVFQVRTINDLPSNNWQSSLCFGPNCFAPHVDSVATTPEFGVLDPLQPGDTLISSLHVFTFQDEGTANVQLEIGTFRNPDIRYTYDFTATATVTDVEDTDQQPEDYFLSQNYPNPFNPATNIIYSIKERQFVSLKVYNILGNEIAVLVNEVKEAGRYNIKFDAANLPAGRQGLSSGIYFYKLITNEFVQTKKMILEK